MVKSLWTQDERLAALWPSKRSPSPVWSVITEGGRETTTTPTAFNLFAFATTEELYWRGSSYWIEMPLFGSVTQIDELRLRPPRTREDKLKHRIQLPICMHTWVRESDKQLYFASSPQPPPQRTMRRRIRRQMNPPLACQERHQTVCSTAQVLTASRFLFLLFFLHGGHEVFSEVTTSAAGICICSPKLVLATTQWKSLESKVCNLCHPG